MSEPEGRVAATATPDTGPPPGSADPAVAVPATAAEVIHASPDDQTSQPIGNAGARVACAALTPLP